MNHANLIPKLDPASLSPKLPTLSLSCGVLLNVIFHHFGVFSTTSLPLPPNSFAPLMSSSCIFLPSPRLHQVPILPLFRLLFQIFYYSTISFASSIHPRNFLILIPLILVSLVTPVSVFIPMILLIFSTMSSPVMTLSWSSRSWISSQSPLPSTLHVLSIWMLKTINYPALTQPTQHQFGMLLSTCSSHDHQILSSLLSLLFPPDLFLWCKGVDRFECYLVRKFCSYIHVFIQTDLFDFNYAYH